MGYELITKPGLLLLDEPTSGLDSHTSLQIAKLIKEQANRGMAILTTIHSPSSEIFNIFDRIIILSDG
jgi:ABC-type multidrug transport system ATPase subunit